MCVPETSRCQAVPGEPVKRHRTPDHRLSGSMSCVYLSSYSHLVIVGVSFYVPAFIESPVNSTRLTGRCPLPSKPKRPHAGFILPPPGQPSTLVRPSKLGRAQHENPSVWIISIWKRRRISGWRSTGRTEKVLPRSCARGSSGRTVTMSLTR